MPVQVRHRSQQCFVAHFHGISTGLFGHGNDFTCQLAGLRVILLSGQPIHRQPCTPIPQPFPCTQHKLKLKMRAPISLGKIHKVDEEMRIQVLFSHFWPLSSGVSFLNLRRPLVPENLTWTLSVRGPGRSLEWWWYENNFRAHLRELKT